MGAGGRASPAPHLAVKRRRPSDVPAAERLVMFAGPPCSGKTTVTERLCADAWPAGLRALDLEPLSSWRVVCDGYPPEPPSGGRLLFHYDFLRPQKHPRYGHFRDTVVHLLDRAGAITLVTFWADAATLRRRMRARRRRLVASFLRGRLAVVELEQKLDQNRSAARYFATTPDLLRIYDDWLTRCESYPVAAHWLLETTAGAPELSPLAGWADLRRRLATGADPSTP